MCFNNSKRLTLSLSVSFILVLSLYHLLAEGATKDQLLTMQKRQEYDFQQIQYIAPYPEDANTIIEGSALADENAALRQGMEAEAGLINTNSYQPPQEPTIRDGELNARQDGPGRGLKEDHQEATSSRVELAIRSYEHEESQAKAKSPQPADDRPIAWMAVRDLVCLSMIFRKRKFHRHAPKLT